MGQSSKRGSGSAQSGRANGDGACSSIAGFRFAPADRSAALRAAGAEVVVGDLFETADVYRIVKGWWRIDFGMSVSATATGIG